MTRAKKLSARAIERLAAISDRERYELDKIISEAKRLTGTKGEIRIGYRIADLEGGRSIRQFIWSVNGERRGIIAFRDNDDEESCVAFQACAARYFADGVNAKSVVMHTPDGEERLR